MEHSEWEMADTRPVWPKEKIEEVAWKISQLLLFDPRVIIVGLTGSGARQGEAIHDIDLVVLGDEGFPEGTIKFGQKTGEYSPGTLFVERDGKPALLVESGFSSALLLKISGVREGIPVDLILVKEKVLSDCEYLQSLKSREIFTDFYLRVFGDEKVPLLLMGIDELRSKHNPFRGPWLHVFERSKSKPVIKHTCHNPKCRPTVSWADCREETLTRKARSFDGGY